MTIAIARISRPLSWRHEFIRTHDYRCHYCNRLAAAVDSGPNGRPWHIDHMTALAAGGEDAEENLTLACERCNSLKHVLPYENFRRYARTALWASESERIGDQDLEALAAAFLRTSNGTWIYRRLDDREEYTCQIRAHELQELGDDADDIVGEIITASGRYGGMHNVNFIVLAHRLMPELLAEVHLLRAELAVARGETADTALETSVA